MRAAETSKTSEAMTTRPAQVQAQQAFEGATKTVVLNGVRIVMNYRDGQWWNDRVYPA